jgi:selenide, water dikinase
LEIPFDPNVIVGLQSWSDAGVYKLSDDLAIVQTVDFFTPIVDDPLEFGRIAVANALSDVYAIGGRPITAMNLVCFPAKTMDIAVLREILRGGMDKLCEAEVTLVGGHSVDDPELKYGLSVTGIIHPKKVITNAGAMPGDALILTKPIGTGIINTAIKAGMAAEEQIVAIIEQMAMLNRKASELMQEVGVHACTDITGFGLLGHASEIVQNSSVGMEIKASSVPISTGAIEFARMGLIPGGTYRNRDFRANMVVFAPAVPEWAPDILFDPQTSGGLLIAVSQERAPILLAKLHEAGCAKSAVIGKVIAKPADKVRIR